MNWVFQANEKYFNIIPALRDLDEVSWIITRYRQESYSINDNVAIWKSGKNAGIYALGYIKSFVTPGRTRPNPGRYWSKIAEFDWSFVGKPHAVVAITSRLLDAPLLRTTLIENPKLAATAILRSPIGTNFKVTDDEWKEITRLAKANEKSAKLHASA